MRELELPLQGRGSLYCFRQVEGLAESVAWKLYGVGKLSGSLADAGHSWGGVHARVAAAIWRLCLKSTWRGGRAASAANMVPGVDERQLVAHLNTLFQKTSSLWVIVPLGTKRSAPYATTGSRRDETKRWVWRVVRLEPGGDSLLITEKAPWAKASRLEKCGVVVRFGANQSLSHLTSSFGRKGWASRVTGIRHQGERSLGVCQCISSVLGTENERPSLPACRAKDLYLDWRFWTFLL